MVGGGGATQGATSTGRPRWLTRNLLVLTAVSLTQDTASELLAPLLPLLLTGVLAAPPVVLGLVEGVANAAAGLTRYVAGRWSDRRGRRPFIGIGYWLAALGKVLVAAATLWPMVLVGRVVDRLGKGIRSAPRDALIAESVPARYHGRAFGFHRAGDTLGAVIGPLIGLLALAVTDDDLGAALWWAVVPAVLSALLVLLVREPGRATAPRPRPSPTSTGESRERSRAGRTRRARQARVDRRRPVPLPRRFWLTTAGLTLVSLVNFPDALVLLRLVDLEWSSTQVVLAYVGFNIVHALGSYPAGWLADRRPQPVVFAAGLLAFAIAYAGLGLVDGGPLVVVLVAGYGLFPAFTDGVGKAWVAALVPASEMGRAQGIFQGLTSGGVLVAGLWAGLAWSVGAGRGSVPLVVAGSAGLVAAVGLVVARDALTPERPASADTG